MPNESELHSGTGGSRALRVGSTYTRADVRGLLGLPPLRGGAWDTGYVRHENEWYLFPNIGTAGRTGHDYGNRWEGDLLRWYGKTGTHIGQPAIKALLSEGAIVHLFGREADRDPFTYYGRVRPHQVVGGTPVEVVWAREARNHVDAALPEEVSAESQYFEGAVRTVTVNAFERDPRAREACIAHWGWSCAVCGLRMQDRYGPVAARIIHVHHLRPLSEIREGYMVRPVEDLRPVCPNCHAVIHASGRVLPIEEVQDLIRTHSR